MSDVITIPPTMKAVAREAIDATLPPATSDRATGLRDSLATAVCALLIERGFAPPDPSEHLPKPPSVPALPADLQERAEAGIETLRRIVPSLVADGQDPTPPQANDIAIAALDVFAAIAISLTRIAAKS